MIFFRMIQYDFRQNARKNLIRCLIAAAVSAFFFFCFSLDALHIFWTGETLEENLESFQNLKLSLCDSLLYLTGGMLPVSFSALADSFQFPVRWLFPHMLVLYFSLNYARNDLTCGGIQVITRTNNKSTWWLSKCVWDIITVLLYFAVEMAVWLLLASISGESGFTSLNHTLFEGFFNESPPDRNALAREYLFVLCFLPMAVCISISLLQMTLTLYMKPIFAYLIIVVYYVAGIYYSSPLFLSNYALSVRSSVIGIYNFRPETGLYLCTALGVASVAIGAIRIHRMDFLSFDETTVR